MVDTAGGTVTVPDVRPDRTRDPEPGAPHTGAQRPQSGREWGLTPTRSALDGLRSLGRAKAGGGGRGSRPQRRPDANGSGRIDLRNTWQILAGSILIPLGVVFILMAWYGAAHTAYVQQQIPYLVSGSFAGLACIVLGGLLYWAHWLYRIYDQADLHHEEQLKAFEQTLRAIVERVGTADTDPGRAPLAPPAASSAGVPAGGGPGGAAPGTGSGAMASSGERAFSPSYVVTSTGSVYHAPSCPVIAHHTEGLRMLGAGAVLDLEPCRICLPPSA